MDELYTVDGSILNLIYQNEENGYTILRLLLEEGEVVTVVGTIPCAAPGESLIATGQWVNHPVHGQQFQAQQVERHMPRTEEQILTYLASGVIKGVGPATAQKLVRHFGLETLAVLEEEPDRLTEVHGVTRKKALEIGEAFRYQNGLRHLMAFLSANDLPLSLALRLYGQYGLGAMEAIERNPYLLSEQLYGVDFKLTDQIALGLGFSGNDQRRVEAAVRCELRHNMNNGHVFLPREKLLQAAARLISCPEDQVEVSLDALLERGSIHSEKVGNVSAACYLREACDQETYVARRLTEMASYLPDRGRNVEKLIARVEKTTGVTFARDQIRAMVLAATEGMLLLTGGPGTGKTTSVRGIVAVLDGMGLAVRLLAPTGRAAQRLGEVCGREAQTIHRALGMSCNETTGETVFQKNEQDPLDAEAVVVDEMSMVDLGLMAALLKALKPDCRLIMVGDPDQLPSVGAGNVFADLLRSNKIPTVSLTEIFRQAESSAIVRLAHTVNQGRLPSLKNPKDSDFFFMCRRDPDSAVQLVVDLCRKRLPENMGIPTAEIQVLCPTRKGRWGTFALNRALQDALNPMAPGKRQRARGETVFRTGDRIMQIKNNYDVLWTRDDGEVGAGVFNGDVGILEDMDPGGELFTLRFDDRTATYTADMLDELELAYAVTVHKAQGSEYRAVVLVTLPAAPALMVRGVLYTGVTRARELLVVVGDDSALEKMAANDRQQKRYSGLKWRLCHPESGDRDVVRF